MLLIKNNFLMDKYMLTAAELLQDETITGIVDQILENKEFVNGCIVKIKEEVLNDGDIDLNDVPNLIIIVSLILNNKPKIKINEQSKLNIMKLLLVRLLSEVDYVNLQNSVPLLPDQEKVIDNSLKLLNTSLIVTKKCFAGCCK